MKKVHFINDGVLDPRAFQVMGLSAKDSDDAIGQFGTGLKYAIAGILRTGGKITIRTGDRSDVASYMGSNEVFDFSLAETEFRGKKFNSVLCNGEPLAFTAEYGQHWEAWQWFRELYANALDEGGRAVVDDNPAIERHDTCITVEHDDVFECFQNRERYFLDNPPNEPTIIKSRRGCIYLKGVFVGQMHDTFPFSLSVMNGLDLTEDRTLKYTWQYTSKLANAAAKLTDANDIEAVLESDAPCWSNLSADTGSVEFWNTVERKIKGAEKLPHGLAARFKEINGEVIREELPLSEKEKKQIERVRAVLDLAGMEISAPIIKVESVNDSLFGFAKDGKIFLTGKAFEHGCHDLAQTVLEEQIHITTGHADETRALQDYLFRQLVNCAEQITNEVL